MRTTVTIDPDVQALLKKAMRQQDAPFKRVLNDAVRTALGPRKPTKQAVAWEPLVFNMGKPLVDLTKVNALLDELEVQAYLEKEARRG